MADRDDNKHGQAHEKRQLSRIRDVVGALADAANAVEAGEMEPNVGATLNGIYRTLLEAIRDREAAKHLRYAQGKGPKPKTMPGVNVQ